MRRFWVYTTRGSAIIGGRRFTWRGTEPLLPDTQRLRLIDGAGMLMTHDGYVPSLVMGTRIATTSAKRFGSGPYDLELLDTVTGMSAACRGFERVTLRADDENVHVVLAPLQRDDQSSSRGWYDHGYIDNTYTIVFGRTSLSYLSTRGRLLDGEVVLNALPAKSLPRRVRRFRQRGAVDIGHGMLALSASRPAVWPPESRERKSQPRSGEGAWNKLNPDRPRYF